MLFRSVVSWRSVTLGGQLKMGVQYLPGVAQAVTLKTMDADPDSRKSFPALLLPAMANLKIPASLILPRDVFQTNRKLELTHSSKEKFNIKLGFSVSSGSDFERASFIQE